MPYRVPAVLILLLLVVFLMHAAGEKKTVTFSLGPDALSLIDRRMQRVVEPGRFDVMVGTSSVPLTTVSLEVTAVTGWTGWAGAISVLLSCRSCPHAYLSCPSHPLVHRASIDTISARGRPAVITSRATLGRTSKRRGPAAPGLTQSRWPASWTTARCVWPNTTTSP
jgi:hypothetical protein